MHQLRSLIRKYFGFSRRETNGFLILIPLIALIIVFPTLYKGQISQMQSFSENREATEKLVEEVRLIMSKRNSTDQKSTVSLVELTPSHFNPNTVSIAEMQEMGLSDKLANTINNFRSKGGFFRVKKDLAKIYGLTDETFRKLYDYIELPEKIPQRSFLKEINDDRTVNLPIPVKKDLNEATRDDFKTIKGIGDVLSKRIISFRSGLGGFHSIHQLKEVYALEDSVINRVAQHFYLSDSFQTEKLNVRIATEKELQNHPYINYRLAKLIVAFRQQHELLRKEQLLEIKLLSDSTYQKLAPYIYVSEGSQ